MKKFLLTTATIATFISGAASAEWGYEGPNGPDSWDDINPDYTLCETGKKQSPFNITGAINADLSNKDFDYTPAAYEVVNTGKTIQVNVAGDQSFTVEGEKYKFLQFHFHHPAEYTINGNTFPMTIHFVHKNAAGQLGVIGVKIEEGEENKVIEEIWDNISDETGDPVKVEDDALNIAALMPDDNSYYRFKGSLTTPPCSENVNWFVMANAITASKEQIAAFAELYPNNARPLQDSNNRLIIKDQ